MNLPSNLKTQPPETSFYTLSSPSPGILLVTIDREKRLNSIPTQGHTEGEAIWSWLDNEPTLRVGIITGRGTRSFCAGADLIEQNEKQKVRKLKLDAGKDASEPSESLLSASGFAGLSQRRGKKPVIAAVNGFALGGGFEICLNCDMVIASPTASFALPEIQRGLFAAAGGLARVIRTCGMQLGSELALTGKRLSPQEARHLKLINRVSKTPEAVLDDAIKLAQAVASNSPDAIIVTRYGLREAWENGSVDQASRATGDKYKDALLWSENLQIGLQAFAQKRQPRWVDSKL